MALLEGFCRRSGAEFFPTLSPLPGAKPRVFGRKTKGTGQPPDPLSLEFTYENWRPQQDSNLWPTV